jgi:hypothetical protein
MDDARGVGTRRSQAPRRRAWRIRPWIRIACLVVIAALVWVSVWISTTPDDGVFDHADDPTQAWGYTIIIATVLLYLSWVPVLVVYGDGRLVLQGWTRRRETHVTEVTGMGMNEFGLVIAFADGSTFTSVIFQATRVLNYPRWFDFAEAITGKRPN